MKNLIIILSVVLSANLFAGSKAASKSRPVKKDNSLREEMNKISHKIRELGPMIAKAFRTNR